MKTVLIISDDKMGRHAIASLDTDVSIYLNRSNSPNRIAKLIRNRIIRVGDLLNMAWAELRRSDIQIRDLPVLHSNQDVLRMLQLEQPDRVICFRAGLIISRRTLKMSPQFLNLHYADLPEWGGLGSVARALRAKAFDQNACLHEMVPEIDGGTVLVRQPYQLDPLASYKTNEDTAFGAGLKLLKCVVRAETL